MPLMNLTILAAVAIMLFSPTAKAADLDAFLDIPPPAAEAGFTTLALNSDFRVPLPSNWLGGCMTAGSGDPVIDGGFYADDWGHTWWLNLWWSPSFQPCTTVQVQDPDYGDLVLDMPLTVSTGGYNQGTTIQSASHDYRPAALNDGNQWGTSKDFPNNIYTELTARMSPAQSYRNLAFLTWNPEAISYYNEVSEWDMIEGTPGDPRILFSAYHGPHGPSDAAWIWTGWGPPQATVPASFDPNGYNTYGYRITSDGYNAVGCGYINGSFMGCGPPAGLDAYQATARLILVLTSSCDFDCNDGFVQHLYVQRIRVLSCQDWLTTECNRPVLSGAP